MELCKEQSVYPGNRAVRRDMAVGIAATMVFYLTAMFIPLMGFVAGIFTPLPTLIAFYRWGSPVGYWVPGGVAVLGTALLSYLNMAQGVPYLLEMLLLGLFLGMGMRRQWSLEWTIASGALLVFSTGALTLWVATPSPLSDLLPQMERDLREAITLAVTQYGGQIQDKPGFDQLLKEVVPTLVRLFPGMALASALGMSWLNVLAVRRYCRLRHIELPSWPEWSHWKAPEQLVWGVVASGFLFVLSEGTPRLVAANALIVLGAVYFLQGLAIVGFFADKWRMPRMVLAFLYALLFLQQYATIAAALMGLFDMWLDFRRLTKKPDQEE